MSDWRCPEDWVHKPEMQACSGGHLISILFGNEKRWNYIRTPELRRCNASGKIIWPYQKAWRGVVATIHMEDTNEAGYKMAWLTDEQYMIQKLKGNI